MTEFTRYAKWNGTAEEWRELQIVVMRHCTCATPQVCATHEMVVRDQRAINGMVFARRIVERLLVEEFRPMTPVPSISTAKALHPTRARYGPKALVKIPLPAVVEPLPAGEDSTAP